VLKHDYLTNLELSKSRSVSRFSKLSFYRDVVTVVLPFLSRVAVSIRLSGSAEAVLVTNRLPWGYGGDQKVIGEISL
jgi:hypothetical protein